ncbi:MAG: SsrA-binding protein SmpB [Polyangiaceae bacterium]|nr:SsrA-binding protein SmpB [Polyangiaceae bacterium]
MSKEGEKRAGDGLVLRNKRAGFEYELGERFEAGIVLSGSEVKILRSRAGDLSDAWVAIENGEAFLHGMNIPILSGAAFGHLAKRKRKLLLHAREIAALAQATQREGMTAVAVSVYFKSGRVKVEVALARGKKQHDKRHALREREASRDTAAEMARVRRG